jgi:peptidyl-prolyl cis-trans isomerase D
LSGGVVFNNETKTNDTVPSFKNASNVAEYIAANSDTPYDSTYVSKQDLPAEHAEALFNLPTGEVYGPYINGKYYVVSKSMGRKSGAKAKASHVLISWEGTQVPSKKEKRTKEEAKVKAESILAQAVANPGSFAMLALTNSDDSSAQSGGDLGYFGPNQMVTPFNDYVFANPVGKIGLVETEFGYHIINVTDKQDAIRLATVSQKVDPSQKTTDDAYTKATKFEMDAASKDFAAVAKAAGVTVNPAIKAKPMDEMFGSVGNQRQIVKWAYSEAKVGDVKRFEVVNVGHVIAKLTKINEKGLMTVEEAKPMIESIIKNEKKAEKLKAKASGSSLEAIAKANATTVQQAVDVTVGNPILNGVGAEQKVVGTAFGTAAGKLSAPIEGNSGIYVIKAKSVLKAPKAANYTDYINKVKATASQGVGRVIPALKSDAKIEDNRLEFY